MSSGGRRDYYLHMALADFGAIGALWVCLSVFLILVGIALTIMLMRLADTAKRLTSLLSGFEEEAAPLINKVSGTVDRVNLQLDKADVATTSAVDAVVAIDKTVRVVTGAIAWPVKKISALFSGAKYGASSLRAEGDVGRAYEAGMEAAARRERDIEEELARRPAVLDEPSPPEPPRPAPPATGPLTPAHEPPRAPRFTD